MSQGFNELILLWLVSSRGPVPGSFDLSNVNYTYDHVLAELNAYPHLVYSGSYLVVRDTGSEDIAPSAIALGRPWWRGNSPKSALNEFLRTTDAFTVDSYYLKKASVTLAPGGIISRIK